MLILHETYDHWSVAVLTVTVHSSFFPTFGFFNKYVSFCTGSNLLTPIFMLPYIIMDLPIFIVTAISTAVDKAIPTSKSGRPESQPVSNETLPLIKEKRRLRRQYSQAHDPLVKTLINQLQKEIKDNLRIESQASWEKFCNDISLETSHTESWHQLKTFSNQRVSAIIRHCVSMRKPPRLTQIRHNSLPNLSKDTLAFRVITLI